MVGLLFKESSAYRQTDVGTYRQRGRQTDSYARTHTHTQTRVNENDHIFFGRY